ncbi:hypothetical protein D5086_030068 [Populus alba]|uniref:Uncharacterized protein n=1 Tax=Populus alba TaxID=43335 RepID=A0ACC4AMG6_POPAL
MLKGAVIDFSPLTAWGVLGGSDLSVTQTSPTHTQRPLLHRYSLSNSICSTMVQYYSGNLSAIARLGMDVINRLIAASCWQNIHAVPQHGAVFGIRVVDGYGAPC